MANKTWKASLVCGAAIVALGTAGAAAAQQRTFNIPTESAIDSIPEFGRQAGVQITAPDDQLIGVRTPAIKGQRDARQALKELLAGTGLRVISDNGAVIVLHRGGEGASPPAVVGAGAAPTQVNEVLVTGTLLRHVEPLSPVITNTRQALQMQGYSNVADAVQSLPQDFKGGASADVNALVGGGGAAAGNYGFITGANLRGLGDDATLVLLNGRRLAPTARGATVDISQIPLSAIDRVEVLTDGASATYGSDAVAGVVNIITRKDFSGVETGYRESSIANGKGPNYGGNVLAGYNWTGGNALLNVDYEADSPLSSTARSFSTINAKGDVVSLLPKQQAVNVLASGSQDITPSLTASGDFMYDHRIFYGSSVEPGNGDFQSGSSRDYNAGGQLDYAINKSWNISLIGGYSNEADQDNVHLSCCAIFRQINYIYQVGSAELRADGELFSLPGGIARLALGGVYRAESYGQTGDAGIVNSARQSEAAYEELLLPIVGPANNVPFVNQLRVDIASRFDHYSDFGNTVNPKFSLEWSPVKDLTFHGTYSTSFLAPALYELSNALSDAYVFPEPNSASPTGKTLALEIDGTNPNLKPQKSTNIDVGFSYEPFFVPGLKLNVDFFDIEYKDRIVRPILNGIGLGNIFQDATFLGPLLQVNPSISQVQAELNAPGRTIFNYAGPGFTPAPFTAADIGAIADLGYENAASSHVQGLDLSVRYDRTVPAGRISVAASGQYLTVYNQQFLPASTLQNLLNTYENPPRFRGKVDLGWNYGDWTADLRVNYTNSYTNPDDLTCRGGCTIKAWTTADITVGYTVSRNGNPSVLRGLRLTMSVTDIFDASPPFAFVSGGSPSFGYDSTNSSPLGRALSFAITKRW